MKRRILSAAAAFFLYSAILSAQSPTAPAPVRAFAVTDDPSPLLNLTLETAWTRFGPPKRLLAVRGNEPWQDDVAFEYPGGFSIFWFRDHLWQIRLTEGYTDSCFGVFLGDALEKALSLMGQPDRTGTDYLEWRLPYQGYPVLLRVRTREAVVWEIYVYRSDF